MSGPFKMKYTKSAFPFSTVATNAVAASTMGITGKNTKLIEALKKQDEAELELEAVKKTKDDSMNQEINI